MKKIFASFITGLFACMLLSGPLTAAAQQPNYIKMADSCLKVKDYVCAATNYDLYLSRVELSNGIAYRAAVAWTKTGNKDSSFKALELYARSNVANNYIYFSDELVKDNTFAFLHNDARWTALIDAVKAGEAKERAKEKRIFDSTKSAAKLFETTMDVRPQLGKINAGGNVYSRLAKAIIYRSPKPFLIDSGITLFIKVDTTDVPFYVHLPGSYNPSAPSPVIVALHGAVKYSIGYGYGASPDVNYNIISQHIPVYTKDYIIVYPKGTKTINWMTTESGFDMVNRIVIKLKSFFNIDDNRVELLGHSNGATGVFTYLVKSPTLYAGFYGMNTQPRVYIGGTFLKNGMTRHFYDFTTDKDYYYPIAAVKTIGSLANKLGVDWHTQLNPGYPHWFPSMKEAKAPMAALFADMSRRVRNPYPKSIYFETDDIKYGNSDWITITRPDTLIPKAAWQADPNFKITDWTDVNDFNKTVHREEWAFDYPHRSGAVKAQRAGNVFHIETSDVAAFTIRLNRDLIDYSKPVTIYVNGGKRFSRLVKPDKTFTLNQFRKDLDRKVIWENEIALQVNR